MIVVESGENNGRHWLLNPGDKQLKLARRALTVWTLGAMGVGAISPHDESAVSLITSLSRRPHDGDSAIRLPFSTAPTLKTALADAEGREEYKNSYLAKLAEAAAAGHRSPKQLGKEIRQVIRAGDVEVDILDYYGHVGTYDPVKGFVRTCIRLDTISSTELTASELQVAEKTEATHFVQRMPVTWQDDVPQVSDTKEALLGRLSPRGHFVRVSMAEWNSNE